MSRRLAFALLLAVAGVSAGPAAVAQDVETRIRQITAAPITLERAMKAGKKAAFLCVHCHGEAGQSAHAHIPNLAGQNPVYLLNQIDKFGDGRRQDEFMSGLIRVLKPDDRLYIALYFAAQSVQPAKPKEPALVAKGQDLFVRQCKACHGEKGHGERHIARLAGQHTEYLGQSLRRYRDGTRERSDPVMTSIARQLKDADIAALTAYIATMP